MAARISGTEDGVSGVVNSLSRPDSLMNVWASVPRRVRDLSQVWCGGGGVEEGVRGGLARWSGSC